MEVDLMERAHYRKVRESKYSTLQPDPDYVESPRVSREQPVPEKKLAERMVTQFIISGIVLAAVLVINLVDTPATDGIKNGIKDIVQRQTSVQEVSQTVLAAKNSVSAIFGATIEEPDALAESGAVPEQSAKPEETASQNPAVAPAATEELNAATSDAPGEFRIDEDILESIQREAEGW
jgi:hypothetical protein